MSISIPRHFLCENEEGDPATIDGVRYREQLNDILLRSQRFEFG